jgi:tetratricopeptide (TPR) repeat protein
MRLARSSRRASGLLQPVLALALAGAAALAAAQSPGPQPTPPQAARASWWSMLNPFAVPSTPPPAPITGVQDPHYGDGLFYFFQSRYFTSLSALMVSQHFGRMPVHADEAEVLRGGLFLSYGLHREAGEVFEQLIARGAAPPVRDRAWYFLAKIRYQRGLFDEAQAALARIEKPLPAPLEEDRALLAANVMMARNDYAGAARALDALAKSPNATRYARYNLGVALVKSGNPAEVARGTALLDELGKQPATTEELRSLRDQTNVALGFAALQAEQGAAARSYLERVRLQGTHSNKALLGFGWAAVAQGRLNQALVPWTELAQRDVGDAAVLEAKIAVPYAYAELGATQQALTLYQEAIGVFDKETARLDESIAAIRDGKFVQALAERNPGEEMGWFWSINELPVLPHQSHLTPIVASHGFQEAFKNYRDLVFLGNNLKRWEDGLAALRDMLANRRLALQERLPEVRAQKGAVNLNELEWRRDAVRAELDRVEREADVAAFANALEREQQQRLDRAKATLEAMDRNDPERAGFEDRYRRALGALRWQQTQTFPDRLWQARKVMLELERLTLRARIADEALAQAQKDEPKRLDAFGARIDALEARVKQMSPRVTELASAQRAALQELAVAELMRQKERLSGYSTQGRFAVAQIYDRANIARDPSRSGPAAATPAAPSSSSPAAPAPAPAAPSRSTSRPEAPRAPTR